MNEDKSSRYHRLKRQASVVSLAWGVLVLAGLLGTGLTFTLRALAESSAGRVVSTLNLTPVRWCSALTVVGYVCLLTVVNEVGGAPVGLYAGFVLERRYGLSNERLAVWLWDRVKAVAVGLLLACGGAVIVYALMAASPHWWWLTAGLAFATLIIGLTQFAPVLLLPLFYRLKPLDRDTLKTRLFVLAERAGARVLGAYEWNLSDKTRKANAALTGLGATRRILVSDTMLDQYSDDEIEVVLAHELAHHVHGDIWKGIFFESGLIIAGFYLAARLIQTLAVPLGLTGVADVAGLPLLVLAAGAVSFVMVPAAHAMSRAFERRADRFALDLTRNPDAFISAMRRLGAQNMAEERPSRIVQWLFYSHPPLHERIAAAQAFANRRMAGFRSSAAV